MNKMIKVGNISKFLLTLWKIFLVLMFLNDSHLWYGYTKC